MKLKRLRKNWSELGKKDPFWAILSDPTKRSNKWDRDEFFKTGEDEIARIMEYVGSLPISFPRNIALDFGCGVGRLTQALCLYFDQCCGVDIAPPMIKLAEKYNRYGNRCRYYLNDYDDLRLFEDSSFDFVYSNIVLQHIEPKYSKNYIKEFLRVLVPGGVLVFQIPSELASLSQGQSVINEALPDSAFRAQIVVPEPPTTLRAGSQIDVRVDVKNISDVIWPARGASDGKYQIRLGSYWLDRSGRRFMGGDKRANLPKDLKPLKESSIALVVTAPPKPGSYILELDMVQEAVAWFKNRGSETARIHVQVQGVRKRLPNLYRRLVNRNRLGEDLSSKIEMYGVRKDVVLDLIDSNGGQVIDVKEDNVAGKEWLSFRYCVTKSS